MTGSARPTKDELVRLMIEGVRDYAGTRFYASGMTTALGDGVLRGYAKIFRV